MRLLVGDLVAGREFHHLFIRSCVCTKLPLSKPREGRDSPEGGTNLKCSPEGVTRESVMGLNSMDPANVIAVVNSGLVKKFIVPGLPSFRALSVRKTLLGDYLKLRLKLDKIAFS
jgi:hypothetical protein